MAASATWHISAPVSGVYAGYATLMGFGIAQSVVGLGYAFLLLPQAEGSTYYSTELGRRSGGRKRSPCRADHGRRTSLRRPSAQFLKGSKKSVPPVPRRFGLPAPHPRFGTVVQLPSGDTGRLVNLVAIDETLPGQSLVPEEAPPHLDELSHAAPLSG
jgi:hypothetical protein